jgi:hypothetical protein
MPKIEEATSNSESDSGALKLCGESEKQNAFDVALDDTVSKHLQGTPNASRYNGWH